MDTYINKRYNEWADWCARGRVSGLGYPRRSNFMRLTPSSEPSRVPVIDADAWEIEQVVMRLSGDEQQLVRLFYLRTTTTVDTIAKDMHCSRDTVYARLNRVHAKTLGWLNDMAAGVALPAIGRHGGGVVRRRA